MKIEKILIKGTIESSSCRKNFYEAVERDENCNILLATEISLL